MFGAGALCLEALFLLSRKNSMLQGLGLALGEDIMRCEIAGPGNPAG